MWVMMSDFGPFVSIIWCDELTHLELFYHNLENKRWKYVCMHDLLIT